MLRPSPHSALAALAAFVVLVSPVSFAAGRMAAPMQADASQSPRFAAHHVTAILEDARNLDRLHALIVAQGGDTVLEQRFRGPALDQPVNIKSASKGIIAALVGRAIAEGLLE